MAVVHLMKGLRMKRNRNEFNFVLTSLFFITSVCVSVGHASADKNQSPLEIVKARNTAVEEILNDSGEEVSDETREKLKVVINSVIDFDELSKRSLGKYWEERSEQEKKDFTNVFSQLIKNSSVKKLEIYEADRMIYEEPEINDTKAKVTTVAHKKRKQVEIVYKMHKVTDEWRVYDIEIDGVSTARNYRDSFYKQIAKSSYQEMYDKLVKKLGEH